MDQQTKQAVAVAIDNALTTIAMREFNRLSVNLDLNQKSEKIVRALSSLGRLYSGGTPDYDEWDALFYHWYQPSQINLAYSIITSTLATATDIDDKLLVIDFGCGSMAMQFGVALAIADALEQAHAISEVRIESLDRSWLMMNMGWRIWEQFKLEVSRDTNLRYVSLACELLRPLTPTSRIEIENDRVWARQWGSKCWLSALHVVYESNEDDVQTSLESWVKNLNPDLCIATTQSGKSKLLRKVWGFMDQDDYYLHNLTISPQFSGMLPEITDWRKNLNTTLRINHRYLNRHVTWEWPEAAFVIHAKGPRAMTADDLPW